MVIIYPYADHLTVEEVDYELALRRQDVDKRKDWSSKLRLLRRLFKDDQQERRRYRPLCQFEKEVQWIEKQVEKLVAGFKEKPDVKLVSRLRHYYHRVLRAEAATEEGTSRRQDLLERIMSTLENVPKALQTVEDVETKGEKGEGAAGGSNNHSQSDSGAKPKVKKKEDTTEKPSYDDLLARIAQLETRLKQSKKRREDEDSSESEDHDNNRNNGRRNRNHGRGRRNNGSQNNDRDSSSSDWFGNRVNRGHRHYRRIEHWKLSFSGDSKSISVENFLYKLKKIAFRERVTEGNLLRDIHLILEGQASDWFFTYVDEFLDWQDFEERIRCRFGNPNQDQGIRLKIQERKQQRGESFNAFVSEIERLNKMLSKPLSHRRKFEVVWDNMRHHYRSRIATINVRDLDHLIRLNHRIDAVDTSLQYSSEIRHQRNVHHVDCEVSEEESDNPEDVNVVKTVQDGRHQKNQSYKNVTSDNTGKPSQNTCWNCRKLGHNWRDCKEAKVIFCFGCGCLGRTIRSCPKCSGGNQQGMNGNQGNR